MNPKAERNPAPFLWPAPMLHRIRSYCADVLGWTDEQMDSAIDPVIRRYMERSFQVREGRAGGYGSEVWLC